MIETKAFVIGAPISQSRSPLIHNHWISEHVLLGDYQAFHVEPEDLTNFLNGFREQGFVGGNVTVPHKEALFSYLKTSKKKAELTETALAIGAANTLYLDGDRLVGHNTDAVGFLANLDQRHAGWDDDLSHAVIIGAGGAARAILFALQQRGAEKITVINRTVARAENLIADMQVKNATAAGLEAMGDCLTSATFLVNTSAAGMEGKGALVFDLSSLSSSCVVTDIIYVPLETEFLKAARSRGCATIDGLGMLLHQAVPGFEAWFGVKPDVTEDLRLAILADMGLNDINKAASK